MAEQSVSEGSKPQALQNLRVQTVHEVAKKETEEGRAQFEIVCRVQVGGEAAAAGALMQMIGAREGAAAFSEFSDVFI